MVCVPCLGATPRSGWAVDPFGHSSTMPYLLRRANISSMLIQRVHYIIKKHFSATHSLEFMWRQAWGEARPGQGAPSHTRSAGVGGDTSAPGPSRPCRPSRGSELV